MGQILNLGHRGHPNQHPENTLKSFTECLEGGAEGFECDVRMTKDGQLVVFHDDDLKRLCGVEGSVEEMDFQSLRELKVLESEELIPTVEELVLHFPHAVINFEIKTSERFREILEKLEAILSNFPLDRRYLFSSFSMDIVDELHRRRGSVFKEVGLIMNEENFELIKDKMGELEVDFLVLPPQVLEDPRRHLLKNVKVPMLAWSLNDQDAWQQAGDLNIVGFITDEPTGLYEYLKLPPQG